MGSTDKPYIRKDGLRACSICGVRWHFSDLRAIGQNRWACPDDYDGLTSEQISRYNARVKPLLIKQYKNPLITGEVPDYRVAEGIIFNLVCQYATTASFLSNINAGISAAATVATAGQCAVYLSDIIRENDRPAAWIARAKTTLATIGTYLRSKQWGPAGSGLGVVANTNALWGATVTSGFDASVQAWGTLGLIRAFSILGADDFRVGAIAGADFMRQTLQRGDALLGGNTTTPPGVATPFYCGGGFSAGLPSGNFKLNGGLCMWPLSELGTVLGTSYVLGNTTGGGDFGSVPSGTIATTLSEARKFYAAGSLSGFSVAPSTGVLLPTLAPLSSTTPRQSFLCNLNGGNVAGGGQFHLQSYALPAPAATEGRILASDIAPALRGLYEYEGYSSTVASIYEWLMTTASTSANEPLPTTSKESNRNSYEGVYSASTGLPVGLGVLTSVNSAPYPAGGGAWGYDIGNTGLLSPVRIASGRDTSACKLAFTKPILSQVKPPGGSRNATYAGTHNNCGLSFQETQGDVVDIGSAAQFGMSFRYAPKMSQVVNS
jgi:hypothetical protein